MKKKKEKKEYLTPIGYMLKVIKEENPQEYDELIKLLKHPKPMKPEIENLKAQMRGVKLNFYQKGLALDEFYKLIDYVTELEKLNAIHNVSGSDILILLERKFPTVYEIHRKEIRRAENLVLTTTDKEFAERLVNAYNHYR
jgi:hypothetical protein